MTIGKGKVGFAVFAALTVTVLAGQTVRPEERTGVGVPVPVIRFEKTTHDFGELAAERGAKK